MTESCEELVTFSHSLKEYINSKELKQALELVSALQEATVKVSKSWSGSWIGYHANVYYSKLDEPPPREHFSSEWGLVDAYGMGTSGDWREFNQSDVRGYIFSLAGNPDLTQAQKLAATGDAIFNKTKSEILSIFELSLSQQKDPFIERLMDEVKKITVFTANDFIKAFRPSGNIMFAAIHLRFLRVYSPLRI